jgi:hypothetical protein
VGAPSGLGFWIAYKPLNAAVLLKQAGASWVAPRAGFNGWNDPGLMARNFDGSFKMSASVEKLKEYKDAGLALYPWIYPNMIGWHSALEGFGALWDTGLCDGLLVDAEAEWCGPDAAYNAQEARAFVLGLRTRCPGAWIAHAPMDYLANHPTFPWVEFGELDAVMPQIYAYEHDDRGHAFHLERVEAQWAAWEAKHPEATKPRWPIGCTYRPKARGYTKEGKPIPLTPWPDQGARVAADVVAFLDHPLVVAAQAPSLYSLEASPSEVLQALADRVPGRPEPLLTHPETAANPLGWQDRAEQAAAERAALSDTDPAPAPTPGEGANTLPSTPASKKEPSA